MIRARLPELDAGGPALPGPPRGRAGRVAAVAAGSELLADHPQRQKLVALQPQDRPQPLDVGLAVEAVAAGGAAGREQLLVLEVADLGDRDVVKLAPEDLGDGADRQRLARRGGAVAAAVVVEARGLLGGDVGGLSHYFSR